MTTVFIIFTLILAIALIVCGVDVSKLKNTVSKVESELNALTFERDKLSAENSQLQTLNTNLNSSKCYLETQVDALRKEYKECIDELNSASLSANEKEKEINSLKTKKEEAEKISEQLQNQLNDAVMKAETLSLDNCKKSLEISKLAENLADAEARLTPPITENISDEEIAARIKALHTEDVNGQESAILPLIEEMKAKIFPTPEMRNAFRMNKPIFNTPSFIKRYTALDEKCLSAFITSELVELAHSNKIGIAFDFNLNGRNCYKHEVLDVSKNYEHLISWEISESRVWISFNDGNKRKSEIYRALGYDYRQTTADSAFAYMKKVHIAENCGVALKDNSELINKFIFQFYPILEEDIADIQLILYYED